MQTFGSARAFRLANSRSPNSDKGSTSTNTISKQIIEIGMNDGFQHTRGFLESLSDEIKNQMLNKQMKLLGF